MAPEGNRANLGYKHYENSPILSDIVIRYGANRERIFYGHKIILSAASNWFRAAFTGRFAESASKEIVLKGDDPIAFQTMLIRPYNEELRMILPKDEYDSVVYSKELLLSFLEIYRVADKYDMPNLMLEMGQHFNADLTKIFIKISKQESPDGHAAGFLDIVLKAYEVTNGDKECLIMQNLLEYGGQILGTIRKTHLVKDVKINEGHLCLLYRHAIKSYAELGRDICVTGLDKKLLQQS